MDWLLDVSVFTTRNNCGVGWTDKMITIYQLSNMLIALAYFAIPISLMALYKRLTTVRQFVVYNPWIILMFMLFITLCGVTHISHVVVFWYPAYRLFALIDALTAIVSLITAIILPVVIYDIFRSLPKDESLS